MIGQTLLNTTFWAHCLFSYSFTASVGSDGTTAGRVESPRHIMVHQGFRRKEVRRARQQNIDYTKQHHTPHCWLPAKVMHPANSTKHFSWLTRSTPISIVEECANMDMGNYGHVTLWVYGIMNICVCTMYIMYNVYYVLCI